MPDKSNVPPFVYDPPKDPWLVVLHSDRDMVVINKPGGLLSVPGRSPSMHDSILSRVQDEHPLALAVHRLDMDTSGVMVVATRRKAEKDLRQQFRERHVEKLYVAEVWGHPQDDQGSVELPISTVASSNGPRNAVDLENGRPALTHYTVIERRKETALVHLHPVTGRPHQLRVHMLALGHPIVGDRFYGRCHGPTAQPMHLHSNTLKLRHPFHGSPMTFCAPAPFG